MSFVKIPVSSQASYSSPSAKLVRLSPSLYYLRGVYGLHGLAIIATFASAISLLWQVLLCLFIVVSLTLVLRQWRSRPVYRVQCLHDAWYLLDDNKGEGQAYRINRWHFLSVWLMVLDVESEHGKRVRLPFFCDSCRSSEFRWLRVIVRYYL